MLLQLRVVDVLRLLVAAHDGVGVQAARPGRGRGGHLLAGPQRAEHLGKGGISVSMEVVSVYTCEGS